jgi:hypothetical protein
MERFVARKNVEHFEQRLAAEQDPERRESLRSLLAEAREQLRAAEAAHQLDRPKRG